MKNLIAAGAMVLVGGVAMASEDDIVKMRANSDVAGTMKALATGVEAAGATVFARIDHAAGAASVNMDLAAAQLLVFGNPMLGTPAMQDDPLAGLYLPLRVLVYEDAAGQVWLAYDDPEKMFEDLDNIGDDAGYVAKMKGALGKLTAKAAGG